MGENAEIQKILLSTAKKAGAILAKNFGRVKTYSFKGIGDYATNVDLEAEAEIIKCVQKSFPHHSILSEEKGSVGEGEFQWVIDPLDGTVNYAHNLAFFCTSIAVYRLGKPVAGAVFDPTRNELFYAIAGKGAFLNGKRIQASRQSELRKAVVGMDLGYLYGKRTESMRAFNKLAFATSSFRLTGSAALAMCYVACGRFDAYFHGSPKAWDAAASALIVSEAGGNSLDFKGKQWNLKSQNIIACNKLLEKQLLARVAGK